ncbi:serine dehydratase subunit alpha family protein [Abyssisolibacter fermentans]|uniref:L-cysteine desulfidase family protein n=1 Tax=Abyssisolibacter fermentans TaxID=1766203 RepID=UPI00082E123A|nr:L-serine ammonia-lyase, iron-sulfur-dependent, subunit alpha [Abyssisolibacter fermentans]
MTNQEILKLLKREVVPALGCTEPIAVALAAAKASEELKNRPESVEVYVSANILKNGMGVGVPGTGMTGLYIATALGCIGGKSEKELEVLSDVTQQDVEDAKKMVKDNKIKVNLKDIKEKLYIEVIAKENDNYAKVVIRKQHSNIVLVEFNDKVIYKIDEEPENVKADNSKLKLTVDEIYNFALSVDIEDVKFLLDGAKMNKDLADEALNNNYGLQVGKTILKGIESGFYSDDIQSYAKALTAAAADARMSGCMHAVMSNSGSGNQGITVSLPVYAVALKLNADEEKTIRALTISNLIAIHIKTYLGRLSALCGCVVASTGSSCGITYLLGGELKNIKYSIKNMIGDISGMVCDGAKCGCALKVSTGVSSAIQSAMLAINDIEISYHDGIVDDDVENTIKNLCMLGIEGMNNADKVMLDIMVSK